MSRTRGWHVENSEKTGVSEIQLVRKRLVKDKAQDSISVSWVGGGGCESRAALQKLLTTGRT